MVDEPSRHDGLPYVRYAIPWREFGAAFIVVVLFTICGVVIRAWLAELQSPAEIMKTGILGVGAATLVLLAAFTNPRMVETREEGLYILYMLRNSRIIPWSRIRRMTVVIDVIQIHEDSTTIYRDTTIPVAYNPAVKKATDDLIDAIA